MLCTAVGIIIFNRARTTILYVSDEMADDDSHQRVN